MFDQLARVIDGYLIGHRTLQDAEGWLTARTRLIHQSGDRRAIEFANQLEADLIDLGEGFLREATIREKWDGYLRQMSTVVLQTERPTVQTVTSTGSSTLLPTYETLEGDVTLWFTHQFAA